MASIMLRQCVETHWRFTALTEETLAACRDEEITPVIFTEEARHVLRSHILDCMASVTNLTIVKQYEAIASVIIEHDYPERWPELLQNVGNLLVSGEDAKLFASLCCLKVLIGKYKGATGEDRLKLEEIADLVFPYLEGFFEAAVHQQLDERNALLMDAMTKIFFRTNFVRGI